MDNRKIASKNNKKSLSLKPIEKENGLNHLPFITSELHRIENKIITRAGILLLNEFGISKKPTNAIEEDQEKKKEPENMIVSPMGKHEFHQILKNGWGSAEQILSPIKDEDFKAFIRDSLIPVLEEPKIVVKPNRKSAPPPVSRKLFASNPRRSSTPLKNDLVTPSKYLPKFLTPQIGDGPLENRASRLRKMKLSGNKKELDVSF